MAAVRNPPGQPVAGQAARKAAIARATKTPGRPAKASAPVTKVAGRAAKAPPRPAKATTTAAKKTPGRAVRTTAATPVVRRSDPAATSTGPLQPDPDLLREHLDTGWGPVRASRDESGRDLDPHPLATRLRDRLLWMWPVVVLVGLAVASHFYKIAGALAFGIAAAGALLLYAGADTFQRRFHITTGTTILAMLTAVFAAQAAGLLAVRSTGEARTGFNDARGAVVSGADLRQRTFPRAELAGVTAVGVNLEGAVLDHADLAGADLRGGRLRGVRLFGANLSGANLRGADLRGADLTTACLAAADLTGALLDDVDATGAAAPGAIVTPAQTGAAKQWPAPDSTDLTACRR